MTSDFVRAFTVSAMAPDHPVARTALLIARLEYPQVEPERYLEQLAGMGHEARTRLQSAGEDRAAQLTALRRYFYDTLGFSGDREHYDDPRNSCLNQVLERRTGIPITLAVVLMDIAGRAGVQLEGVNFPGHFLLRYPARRHAAEDDILIDPFHGGAVLNEEDCLSLLRRHTGEDTPLDRRLLATANKQQILVRMLLNLKRLYVKMRSFPQARDVTDLLVSLEPASATELRDRGLLAYQARDLPAALRDLERYVQLTATGGASPEDREEREQLWEHIKLLRRRLASYN